MDLRDNKEKLAEMTKIKLKPITVEKGKVLARQIGAAQYLECSSLTQKGWSLKVYCLDFFKKCI